MGVRGTLALGRIKLPPEGGATLNKRHSAAQLTPHPAAQKAEAGRWPEPRSSGQAGLHRSCSTPKTVKADVVGSLRPGTPCVAWPWLSLSQAIEAARQPLLCRLPCALGLAPRCNPLDRMVAVMSWERGTHSTGWWAQGVACPAGPGRSTGERTVCQRTAGTQTYPHKPIYTRLRAGWGGRETEGTEKAAKEEQAVARQPSAMPPLSPSHPPTQNTEWVSAVDWGTLSTEDSSDGQHGLAGKMRHSRMSLERLRWPDFPCWTPNLTCPQCAGFWTTRRPAPGKGKQSREQMLLGHGAHTSSWSRMAFSCSSFLAQYRASSSGMSESKTTMSWTPGTPGLLPSDPGWMVWGAAWGTPGKDPGQVGKTLKAVASIISVPMNGCCDLGSCDALGLTQGQLKMRVQEDTVESGVLGPTDLAVCHDGLRVQRQPLSWTLLSLAKAWDQGQSPQGRDNPNTDCTLASLEGTFSSRPPLLHR